MIVDPAYHGMYQNYRRSLGQYGDFPPSVAGITSPLKDKSPTKSHKRYPNELGRILSEECSGSPSRRSFAHKGHRSTSSVPRFIK